MPLSSLATPEQKSDFPGGPAIRKLHGFKFSNPETRLEEELMSSELDPRESIAEAPLDVSQLGGFNELLRYVTPSPDQEEAGSCLYMSVTGIAEWWLGRLNPKTVQRPDGIFDISERDTMHLSSNSDAASLVENWKTDTALAFNGTRSILRNSALRFTKGWYKEDSDGDYVEALPQEQGAEYGPHFNWIAPKEKTYLPTDFISLPRFERTVIFADPTSNQWNVAVTPDDIVEKVKVALTSQKAPVQVIYNHQGYWHSVYIAGYNDNQQTRGCPFVQLDRQHFKNEITRIKAKLGQELPDAERERLVKRLTNQEDLSHRLEARIAAAGGCKNRGVFYVRDSIYSDSSEAVYDYDLGTKGEERNYSKRIILREYDWLRFVANHVIQVTAKN